MTTRQKKCLDCKEVKSIKDFAKRMDYRKRKLTKKRNFNLKPRIQSYCKKCMGKRTMLWQSENRKKYNEYARQYRLKNNL